MFPFLIIAGVLLVVGIISISSIKKKMHKKKINSFLINKVDKCKNQIKISAMGKEYIIKGRGIDDEIYKNVGTLIYL